MKAVWSNVKALMSPPAAANASPFSGDDCAKHFAEKVAKMRASTVNAPRPVIIPRPVTSVLSSFQPVAVKEIKDLLAKLPGKHRLELRRLRADLILCYKIINGLVSLSPDSFF